MFDDIIATFVARERDSNVAIHLLLYRVLERYVSLTWEKSDRDVER